MALPVLAKGFIIGFIGAAPFGPVGIMCLRRALTRGGFSSFLSGAGLASGNAIWVFIGLCGLSAISGFIVEQEIIIRLIGGILLCIFGIKSFFYKIEIKNHTIKRGGRIKEFTSIFLLVLTNPIPLFTFTAVFAALGIFQTHLNSAAALKVSLTVFAGSLFLWIVLAWLVGMFRENVGKNWVRITSHIASMIILIFGLTILLSLFTPFL
jgi:threonine/homoserine/homoserine lactone efflux protein